MMRTKYIRIVPLLATAIILCAGCAGPFPSRITDQVDKRLSFADLHKDPGSYKGKWVMFAGVIVSSVIENDGSTYLEVVQKPADNQGRPLQTDESGGRFIAVSKQFLDPAVYQGGRVITVVGEVIGETFRRTSSSPFLSAGRPSGEKEGRQRAATTRAISRGR